MAALERGAGGAIEYSSLATGPRRYGPEQSQTATSGTVDPTGYLERERKRRARQKALNGMVGSNAQQLPAAAQGLFQY
jgi:hypothetical protein